MLRVTLANVRGHLVRLLLTGLAVMLGTAFVAGSFVLTDSIDETFSAIFATSESTDAVVRLSEGSELGGLDLALGEELQQVEGVERAIPVLQGNAVMQGADGTAVRSGGAPAFGFAWDPEDPAVRIVDGRAPESADELAVESTTLERSGLAVGDETVVVVNGTPFDVTIVGEMRHPTADSVLDRMKTMGDL